MPVTEDIVVAVVALFLLVLGKKHQFLFLLAFVGAGVRQLFEAAFLRPVIADGIAYLRRQTAEEELQCLVPEEIAQSDG